MWKYNGRVIREGKSWSDDNGIQHPANWIIWSPSDKAAAGLTEVTPETPPDSRLYTWTYESDAVTISKTAKSLADVNEVDENGDPVLDENGDQVVTLGVKSVLKNEVKSEGACLIFLCNVKNSSPATVKLLSPVLCCVVVFIASLFVSFSLPVSVFIIPVKVLNSATLSAFCEN